MDIPLTPFGEMLMSDPDKYLEITPDNVTELVDRIGELPAKDLKFLQRDLQRHGIYVHITVSM